MSSPIQPPPNMRRPPSSTSLSQPPITSSGQAVSPYAPQLPPPPLISPGGPPRPGSAGTSRPLPPPPLSDLPYHSSPIASSSTLATSGPTYASISQSPAQGLPSLPPPSSMTSPVKTHRSSIMSSAKSSLPPIPPRGGTPSSASSPYADNGTMSAGRTGASSPPPPPSGQPSTQSTRQQQTVSQTPSNNSGSNGGYRPLNVRDALTYLDQVKVQFSSQPDVYNRFLDIMKDFKSQSIDTPGVIERVSILFNGHPELISGFNTFLPPGYRIECSTDPNEPDVIRVTTPTGTTLTRTSRPVVGGGLARSAGQTYREQESSNALHGSSSMSALPPQPPPMPAHGAYYQSPYGQMPPPHPPSLGGPHPLQPPMSSHPLHPPAHSSYMSGSGTTTSRRPASIAMHEQQEPVHSNHDSPNSRRAPVEFNHAINYVNKIKTRYASEPETYKQFLEILQTYQKERKPIQEVFAQVQYLFNGAPDLLFEFKQFLPEITGQPSSEFFDDVEPSYMGAGPKRGMYGGMSSSQYLPPGKKKRTTRTKGSKIGVDEDYIAGYPASAYFDPAKPSISMEEIELFEQIRKHIGNKPSYEEFLKILNLYTQQIIDADVLMKQVEGFIGSDRELFDWFKTTVAVDLKDQTIERPSVIIPKPDLNHCATVDSSPSYRLVSKEWQNQPCSARDQLCWEVLNDEYVSHPIWASEDSGFVASKKNQYEEAMHRTEEERYDYDLNIDANLNAIALLEPIAKKLEQMTPEEQENFRLEPGLGGQSVTIYERIIKKIYDEDRGKEIIELLYSNPAKVVPILLKRLTQKDEEWRKAQHEWNKTWREVDAKNFYRSLDYQGLTFKSNDRKAMAVKSLVSEIETLHEEMHAEGNNGAHPEGLYPLLFSFDDATIFKDVSRIIFSYIEKQNGYNSSDRGKVRTFIKIFIPLFFHVDDVIPEGAHIESDDGDESSGDEDEDTGSINTEDSEADGSRSPRNRSRSPTSGCSRRSGRNRNEDQNGLLRGVLKKQSRNTGDDNETIKSFGDAEKSPSVPRDSSETPAPEDSADNTTQQDTEEGDGEGAQNTNANDDKKDHYGNGTTDKPVKTEETSGDERDAMLSEDAEVESNVASHDAAEKSRRSPSVKEEEEKKTEETEGDRLFAAAAAATAPNVQKRTTYSFFCNTSFYCFFRLYQLMYERLQKMKELDAKAKADPDGYKKTNSVALELGLYTNRFDDIDLSNGAYQAILELIDRFFDGDIDQAMFEEKTRYVFATEAHVLFTIDKLTQSIVKQIQLLTSDEKTVELVDLFRGDLTLEATCPRIISVYRLRAEETLGSDENLYKVNFDTQTNRMTIQLLDKDDDMLESTPQDQYENYVASYMDWTNPTQGIDIEKLQPTFLRRTWKPHNAHLNKIFVQSRLQYKIDQDSYHMSYIVGSEDAFVRPPAAARKKDQVDVTNEAAEWRQWLESRSTGWSKDIESDDACKAREEEERKLLSE